MVAIEKIKNKIRPIIPELNSDNKVKKLLIIKIPIDINKMFNNINSPLNKNKKYLL
ncbi:hypothetical protein [Mycoplasmopsis columboralis]|uniref:hypothetical protein n=1 Tax=Mycoplasmopsis columboralis TaxID=171282 RepID=UPI0013ED0264|nr:hypothetical protein [Mycoplasmopsis columboralis]